MNTELEYIGSLSGEAITHAVEELAAVRFPDLCDFVDGVLASGKYENVALQVLDLGTGETLAHQVAESEGAIALAVSLAKNEPLRNSPLHSWRKEASKSPGAYLLRHPLGSIGLDRIERGPASEMQHALEETPEVRGFGDPDSDPSLPTTSPSISARQLIEAAVVVAVCFAEPPEKPTSRPVSVNHALRNLAVDQWFEPFQFDSGNDWIPGYFPHLSAVDPIGLFATATEEIARWIAEWPSAARSSLEVALRYDLQHRPRELEFCLDGWHRENEPTWEGSIEHFWTPLYSELFGRALGASDTSQHRVMTDAECQAEFEVVFPSPEPPRWPWLVAANRSLEEAATENVGYVYVGSDSEYVQGRRRIGPVAGDPERAFRTRGLWALDHALEWIDAGNDDPWKIPEDEQLPVGLRDNNRRWLFTMAPICSRTRSEDLEYPVYLELSEFRTRLTEAGHAIGLDRTTDLENNIARAKGLEDPNRVGLRAFETWAVLAQAVVDSSSIDQFMLLETAGPLADGDDMRLRIDKHLRELENG